MSPEAKRSWEYPDWMSQDVAALRYRQEMTLRDMAKALEARVGKLEQALAEAIRRLKSEFPDEPRA